VVPRLRLVVFVLLTALVPSVALVGCGASGAVSATPNQETPPPGLARASATPTGDTSTVGTAATPPTAAIASASPSVVASPSPAATAEVRISDFRFDPPTITVALGTTVVWTNLGPTDHTTTSKQGLWDSRILHAGQTFRFTFRQPGTYPYWCTLHPEMLGTVVVR